MEKYSIKKASLLILLVCVVFFSAFTSSTAQTNVVQLSPAYAEVELLPEKENVSTEIVVKNNTTQLQRFELFPVEFQQTDALNLVLQEIPSSSSGVSYIELETDQLTLEPGEEQSVSVTVQNQAVLSPGGNYVALVFRKTTENTSETQVLPALASFLLIRKTDGELINLSLRNIQNAPRLFSFTFPNKLQLLFQNLGNVHLIPRGTVKIKNIFGKTIADGSINESSVYVFPGRQRQIETEIKKLNWHFPVQFLTVEASGNPDRGEGTFSFNTSFIYINYKFLLALLVLIVLFSIKKQLFKK